MFSLKPFPTLEESEEPEVSFLPSSFCKSILDFPIFASKLPLPLRLLGLPSEFILNRNSSAAAGLRISRSLGSHPMIGSRNHWNGDWQNFRNCCIDLTSVRKHRFPAINRQWRPEYFTLHLYKQFASQFKVRKRILSNFFGTTASGKGGAFRCS